MLAALMFSVFSVSVCAQNVVSIAAIQGDSNISPMDGQKVMVSGIVTARTRTGFFLQTPDDKADASPATSEGVFVYTRNEPPAEAAVGNAVTITGTVNEFRPRSEPNTLSLTQISYFLDRDTTRVNSKSNPLPKPIALTLADVKLNRIDQFEKYEGMRVAVAELTVTAPTGGRVDIKSSSSTSNGTFFGVIKGMPRPFREPGLDIAEILFLNERDSGELKKNFPKITVFDANPERLRIESSAQLGTQPIDVSAYSEVKGLSGVLHYAYRTYTIFVDPNTSPGISGSVNRTALPAPTSRQFSVAAMNIENFFDDKDDPSINEDVVAAEAFEKRLKKISTAIREHLQMPDVVGIVEADNLEALRRLADRLNADAVSAGKPDPKYKAYLEDGNDGRGIDNGFLVKTGRVKIMAVKQFGKDVKYTNPDTKEENFLNDRPPLMLRASIEDAATEKPFEFTVIINHLKSFNGYNDPKQKDNVRTKKRLQAEFLAKWVRERQKADSSERIILAGDFNAYQFSDGITDLIGTIVGKPAARDMVFNSSEDFVDPDLINLVELIKPAERYSYIFDGNAQVLDHFMMTDNLKRHLSGFGYARLNADFPEMYRNDASRVERFSDHDPAIVYFSLDERK